MMGKTTNRCRLGCAAAIAGLLACAAIPLHAQAPAVPAATVAPSADPLRPVWQPGESRVMRAWQVRAVAAPLPDEANLRASADWPANVAWSDLLDLSATAFAVNGSPIGRKFVYAEAVISRDTAGPAELAVSAGGRVDAWINGKKIGTVEAGPFVRDKARFPARLEKGENRILLRLESNGDWRLAARLLPPGQLLPPDRHLAPTFRLDGPTLVVRSDLETSGTPATVSLMAPGGRIVADAATRRGGEVKLPVGALPQGLYELRVVSADAWGQPIVGYAFWGNLDRAAAARDLVARADRAKAAGDQDAAHWRLLAAIVRDRAGPALANVDGIDQILFEAAELALGRDALVHDSGFVRLAWVDPVDGSSQFCRAYLPFDYADRATSPTILYLHGSNGANPPYERMWGADTRHIEDGTDRHRLIWIEPHGRGNTAYVGLGESDVLNCLAEAKRRLRIDPDRTHLTGESMGGAGTWTLGSRHPELWAAIAPTFGGSDLRIALGPAAAALEQRPMERWLLDSAGTFTSVEALAATPIFVRQGDTDTAIEPRYSRAIVTQLQRWGHDVRYREFPGFGHEDLGGRDELIAWLLAHKRADPPRQVRVRSADIDGASAWWLTVESAEAPMQIIEADAEITEPGALRLDTRNVAAISLALPPAFARPATPLRLVWNGAARTVLLDADGKASLRRSAEPAPTLEKRRGRGGGLGAVFQTPHAIVVGTISRDPEMRRLIRERAEQRAAAWEIDQHVRPRIVDDVAVSAEMQRSLSLVLIGGPAENAVARKLARQLPLKIERTGVVVDGRRFDAMDAVVEMVRPSPWSEDRMVLVVAPTSAAGMYVWNPASLSLANLSVATRLWDWTLQDGRSGPLAPGQLPDRLWIASGIWNAEWRGDDAFVILGDPQMRAAARRRSRPAQGLAVPAATLDIYAGRYELYPGMSIVVRRHGDGLMVDLPGRANVKIVPETQTIFVSPEVPGTIEFRLQPDGKVSEAVVDNGTNPAPFRRQNP